MRDMTMKAKKYWLTFLELAQKNYPTQAQYERIKQLKAEIGEAETMTRKESTDADYEEYVQEKRELGEESLSREDFDRLNAQAHEEWDATK